MHGHPHGLGARYAPDPNDDKYPLRARERARIVRRVTKHWPTFSRPLDQGPFGTCVGHAVKTFLLAAPTRQTTPNAEPTAVTLYLESTYHDEWNDNEGDLHSGTSLRAGMQTLRRRGYIPYFGWAHSVDEAADWLAGMEPDGTFPGGPLGCVIPWWDAFDYDKPNGVLYVPPGARKRGLHCICLTGWNEQRGMFRSPNSHGDGGEIWIPGELLEWLWGDYVEIATAIETRLPR